MKNTSARQRTEFTQAQIIHAVKRWEDGEDLSEIALDYGVPYHALWHATKAARKGKTGGSRPTPAKIQKALERLNMGDLLESIAAEYKLTPGRLRRHIEKAGGQIPVKQIVKLSADEIWAVAKRWKAGETLLAIGKDYPGVAYVELVSSTKDARKRESPDPLSPERIAEAMLRWEAGESLSTIAADYDGVDYYALHKATKELRKGKAGGRSVTPEKAKNALDRWRNGEPLTRLAREFKTSSSTLRKYMKQAEVGHPLPPPQMLDSAQIPTLLALWDEGQRIKALAKRYGFNQPRMEEIIIFARWKRGESPAKIAKDMVRRRFFVRDVIMRYSKVFDASRTIVRKISGR